MCKIAILERFTLLGAGIKSILQQLNECDVIIQAETIDGLLKQLKDNTPDVIIVDIVHGDNAGLKSLRKIRRKFSKVPVLLLVNQNYSDCFEEYIRMGVKGFVLSDAKGTDLVEAIHVLKNGGEYFRKKVWDIFRSAIQKRKYQKRDQHILSDREVAVLRLFASGLSYKEIGANLNISPRTVESHKRNILSKLKISTTADMVRYAYRNHILT